MARLNVKRMMSTLAADKKRQEAAKMVNAVPALTPPIKEDNMYTMLYDSNGKPDMKAADLEGWLTELLTVARDANRRYEAAVAAEQHPNDAIQDILHAVELAPSQYDPSEIYWKLMEFRRDRRDLKKELEVSQLFKEWADKHKAAFDQLQNVLGNIRKVLNRQPTDAYRWKTGAVGIQGDFMQPDPAKPDSEEDTFE